MMLLKTVLVPALFCLIPRVAVCASVVGIISDTKDHPVNAVEIAAQNSAGKVFGRAKSDLQGHYQITGLAPGTYQFVLNPLATGLKGGSGVSYLDPKGLTINWKASAHAMALAMANPGIPGQIAGDPFGYSPGEFAALVTLGAGVIAAAVIGGYGAAGGFSGGAPPTSPSTVAPPT